MNLYKSRGIYGIRNKVNGKVYIGKTNMNFGDRRDCHIASLRGGYHINPHLQKAWNKYGESNFEFIIIESYDSISNEDLNILETKYIEKYKQEGLAYNISNGGDGGHLLGKHLSDETKRRIGEKNRINSTGRKASPATREKMSKSQSTRYANWTAEDRIAWGDKMSKYLVGIKKPKLSEAMQGNKRGATYTPEQVREIRRLHEIEHLGYTEISKIMDIPRPAVYNIATYRRWADLQ